MADALRVERRVDPIGLDEEQPRLSWRVLLAADARRQAAAAVEVASDPSFPREAVVWSSGEVAGSGTAVCYDGPALASRERRFWRVRITDDRGRTGPWSDPASWEMGLLHATDWVGRWIGWIDPTGPSWSSRSPLLRRSFRLAAAPRRARAYISALGFVELRINGSAVGEDRMTPGWTDYRQRIQYQTIDVTHLLRAGENVVAARLGRGWFAGEIASFGAEQYGDVPALLTQLEIELAGRPSLVVATDLAWRAHPGPLVSDDLLHGESIDARDETSGWLMPGYDDAGWQPIVVRAGPGGRLVAQRDPGVRIVAEMQPVAITSPEPDRQIVDVGQNVAAISGSMPRRPPARRSRSAMSRSSMTPASCTSRTSGARSRPTGTRSAATEPRSWSPGSRPTGSVMRRSGASPVRFSPMT